MNSVDVDAHGLAAATSILDREEQVNPLLGRDLRYRWLNWLGYGFLTAAAVVGLVWSLRGLIGLHEPIWYVVDVYVWTSIIFILPHCTTFLAMISLNWRLMLVIHRQEKMVRELGWAHALEAPWAEERAKRSVVHCATLLVGPVLVGISLAFACVVAWHPLPSAAKLHFPLPVPWASAEYRSPWLWAVFACTLWTVVLGCMYHWLHLLSRTFFFVPA